MLHAPQLVCIALIKEVEYLVISLIIVILFDYNTRMEEEGNKLFEAGKKDEVIDLNDYIMVCFVPLCAVFVSCIISCISYIFYFLYFSYFLSCISCICCICHIVANLKNFTKLVKLRSRHRFILIMYANVLIALS